MHNNIGRKEIMIGFDSETIIMFDNKLALEFWLLMGLGLTVNETLYLLKAKASISPDLFEIWHLNELKTYGNASTTLAP